MRVKEWWPYALFLIGMAGCTYLEIHGNDNTVSVEKAGTDIDTDTDTDLNKR